MSYADPTQSAYYITSAPDLCTWGDAALSHVLCDAPSGVPLIIDVVGSIHALSFSISASDGRAHVKLALGFLRDADHNSARRFLNMSSSTSCTYHILCHFPLHTYHCNLGYSGAHFECGRASFAPHIVSHLPASVARYFLTSELQHPGRTHQGPHCHCSVSAANVVRPVRRGHRMRALLLLPLAPRSQTFLCWRAVELLVYRVSPKRSVLVGEETSHVTLGIVIVCRPMNSSSLFRPQRTPMSSCSCINHAPVRCYARLPKCSEDHVRTVWDHGTTCKLTRWGTSQISLSIQSKVSFYPGFAQGRKHSAHRHRGLPCVHSIASICMFASSSLTSRPLSCKYRRLFFHLLHPQHSVSQRNVYQSPLVAAGVPFVSAVFVLRSLGH